MTKARCQTCGARAEWIEKYQHEIAELRRSLAIQTQRRIAAERALSEPVIAADERAQAEPVTTITAQPAAQPATIPVRVEPTGPMILESWTIRAEVERSPGRYSSMALAFRNALSGDRGGS